MKTMCPPGYHHNGFVATHVLGYMMYGYVFKFLKIVYLLAFFNTCLQADYYLIVSTSHFDVG